VKENGKGRKNTTGRNIKRRRSECGVEKVGRQKKQEGEKKKRKRWRRKTEDENREEEEELNV
jgi:hypothetical protein